MGAIVRLGHGASTAAAADEVTALHRQGYATEPNADSDGTDRAHAAECRPRGNRSRRPWGRGARWRRRVARSADCVRQRRESVSRTRASAPRSPCNPAGAWRRPRAVSSSNRPQKARCWRCAGRSSLCWLRCSAPGLRRSCCFRMWTGWRLRSTSARWFSSLRARSWAEGSRQHFRCGRPVARTSCAGSGPEGTVRHARARRVRCCSSRVRCRCCCSSAPDSSSAACSRRSQSDLAWTPAGCWSFPRCAVRHRLDLTSAPHCVQPSTRCLASKGRRLRPARCRSSRAGRSASRFRICQSGRSSMMAGRMCMRWNQAISKPSAPRSSRAVRLPVPTATARHAWPSSIA